MSFAHVDSIDALKELRSALWKFAEAANQSLSEGNAELERMLTWLEHDARVYWQNQIRKRTQALQQAKESLRSKQAVTRKDGSKPPAVEEEKAVALATQRLEQAERKLAAVKQYAKVFQRESLQYKGAIHRFVVEVEAGIPEAAAHLEGLIGSLAQYAAMDTPGGAGVGSEPPLAASSMRRAEEIMPVARPETAASTEGDAGSTPTQAEAGAEAEEAAGPHANAPPQEA